MTVKELIELLSKLDDSLPVVIEADDNYEIDERHTGVAEFSDGRKKVVLVSK